MKKYDIINIIGFTIVFFIFVLLVVNGVITDMNSNHPYILGFFQFMIFASIGELISARVIYKKWIYGKTLFIKAIIWGFAGMFITLSFFVFFSGVTSAVDAGFLPLTGLPVDVVLLAFYISASTNIMSGPVMTSTIRILGNYLDVNDNSDEKVSLMNSIDLINWSEFISFSIVKCIPFFWIPTNTVLFLMPIEYRVSGAAILSLAFGVIMVIVKWKERNKYTQKTNKKAIVC